MFRPEAQTLLFVLSVLAIVPLAALLSHATESVAARTGDAIGGLLNATLGNLTELVIAITALRAGEHMLVKASIVGVIATNTLFMLGASFLLGGLKFHTQVFNRVSARLHASLFFLASVALLIPSAVSEPNTASRSAFLHDLSTGLALLLVAAYGLGRPLTRGPAATILAGDLIQFLNVRGRRAKAAGVTHDADLPKPGDADCCGPEFSPNLGRIAHAQRAV
jgi:Ca2+:H+ antiporter